MPSFNKEELKQIDKVIAKVERQELKQRLIFPVRQDFNPNASWVEYDVFDIQGSAKILADGANASDIKFVGEEKTPRTSKVYKIANGVQYTPEELEAVEMARSNNRNTFNLKLERPEEARRFIMEKENEICYIGESKYGLAGVLSASNYSATTGTKEVVANGAGASPLWSLKTPPERLLDIRTAIKSSSQNGLFMEPKQIVLPFEQEFALSEPFSNDSQFTILDWIKRSLGGMVKSITFDESLSAANNGLSAGDAMLVFPYSTKYLYLALTKDINRGKSFIDLIENESFVVSEKTAGVVVRHKSCLYLGTGI